MNRKNKLNLHKTQNVIKSYSPDILILNEVDYLNPRSLFLKQPEILSKNLYYDMIYAPTIDYGFKYGNALLTKHEILSWENHILPNIPSITSEPRGMIEAKLRIFNNEVMVYGTHLSLNKDIRNVEMEYITNQLTNITLPVIFMGDLNAKNNSKEITMINNVLTNVSTNIDSIDYIFISQEINLMKFNEI